MAFAVKALGGILGGGTVAVGGCGVYSTVTGKPVLFFKGSETVDSQSGDQTNLNTNTDGRQQADDNQNPQNQGGEPVQEENTGDDPQKTLKAKITQLITGLPTGCTVKVWESVDNSRNLTVDSETDLQSLSGELEKVKTQCSSSGNKNIFLKHSGSQWSVMSEKERIAEIIKNFAGCDIKVRLSSTNQNISDVQNGDDLLGLYDVLKTKKDGCKNSKDKKDEMVFHKPSNDWVPYLTDKQQVDDWIKDKANFKDKKCVLKIFGLGENKDIDNEDLSGLPNLLTTNGFENKCTTPGTTEKPYEIVLKKDNGTNWSVMSEHDQFKALIDGWSGKCTVKIKNSESDSGTEVTKDTAEDSVKGLLKNLREIKDCKTISAKVLTFQKEGEGSWKQVTTPAS